MTLEGLIFFLFGLLDFLEHGFNILILEGPILLVRHKLWGIFSTSKYQIEEIHFHKFTILENYCNTFDFSMSVE